MNLVLMFFLSASVSAAPVVGADQGQKIFKAKCATCHGKDGKGNPTMAKMLKVKPEELDLSGDAQKKSDSDFLKVVGDGRKKMPAFKGKLKDAEMRDVLSFVRGLAAKPEAAK